MKSLDFDLLKLMPKSKEVKNWSDKERATYELIWAIQNEIADHLKSLGFPSDEIMSIKNLMYELADQHYGITSLGAKDFGIDMGSKWMTDKFTPSASIWEGFIPKMIEMGYGARRPTPSLLKELFGVFGPRKVPNLINSAAKYERMSGPVINRLKELAMSFKVPIREFIATLAQHDGITPDQYIEGLTKSWKDGFKFFSGGKLPKFAKGGMMPYAAGGKTFGTSDHAIPAILHGGEYVINKRSVDKYGTQMLQNINQGIYKGSKQYKVGGYVSSIKTPEIPKYNIPMSGYAKIAGAGTGISSIQSETTHNYNFYVDNFIGETEWFNGMMKEYNMKVVPANQKQAGLESRVIKTYNGINRGM
jgi:hypothetical protein